MSPLKRRGQRVIAKGVRLADNQRVSEEELIDEKIDRGVATEEELSTAMQNIV
jgi:hypothetical protein